MSVIVIEGANGSGTSTQCKLLKDMLEKTGRDVVLTSHPGSTKLGAELRKMLKFGGIKRTPQQDLFLFAADSIAFYQEYLEKDHDIVLCDRLNMAGSFIYQYIMGATYEQIFMIADTLKVMGWNKMIDHLIVLNCDYDIIKKRLENPNLVAQDHKQGNKKDNYESKGDEFMMKINNKYNNIVKEGILEDIGMFKNINTVDATKPSQEVSEEIWNLIKLNV